MRKKVSYQQLLKEAIAEFDTSKTVDVKGPMLEPILAWKGDGELATHRDAASILERYYFNEQKDDDIEIEGQEQENVDNQKHANGEGTEQAGTSPAGDDIDKTKDKVKDKIEGSENVEDETEVIENAVLEKLIAEMEEEEEEEKTVNEQEEKSEEEEEEEKLDIDKEVEEAVLGPLNKEKEEEEEETKNEEEEKSEEEIEEVFKLFQEAIESD